MPKIKKKQEVLTSEENENLIKRMNRILGQVQGVKKMIEDERNCMEILSQITVIRKYTQ
jgi:DNA-binding FrmR family transcriptional regulator